MNFLHLFFAIIISEWHFYVCNFACLGYSIQIDYENEDTVSYKALIHFLHFLREGEEICLSFLASLCRQMLVQEKLIHLFLLPWRAT